MNLSINVIETRKQMEEMIDQLASSLNQSSQKEWRRGQWRITFETTGFVQSATEDPIYITLHDLSNEGVGFLSRQELKDNQKILLTIETDRCSYKIPAIVKHCTKTLGMNKIGARFDLT